MFNQFCNSVVTDDKYLKAKEVNKMNHPHEKKMSHAGCCCGCGQIPRHFVSKKEKEETLQKYIEELKSEIAGVEEKIQELKN